MSIGSEEIFGLGSDVPQHLDLVRIALSEWSEPGRQLPKTLLPLMNDGGGNFYCLEMGAVGGSLEPPIVYWAHDDPSEDRVVVGVKFVDWMNAVIDDSGVSA